ncbi:hypothetical protein ACQ4PT_032193 [Festuca glaucescens]
MASPAAVQGAFADDGSVVVAAPSGDIWIGSRCFNLAPRHPYNIHNQPGQRANPINFYSEGEGDDEDDDSAPPSQRGTPTNNDINDAAADDAARGILHGQPVGRRIPPAPRPSNPAATLGGPIPEIFVPRIFIQDVSNLAYAVLNGPVRQEMPRIRAALEQNPRCPPFILAPSAFGSALLIFPSVVDRDRAIALGPYTLDGATVTLFTPDAGEEIATTNYDVLVELRVFKYPLALWHPSGANFIFGSLGKLCCVDQCCVTGQDFTVIRAFILLERGRRVPPAVVLRKPNNDVNMVYFEIDNTFILDHGADAPTPPPEAMRPQTVRTTVSRGTQTDDSPPPPSQPDEAPQTDANLSGVAAHAVSDTEETPSLQPMHPAHQIDALHQALDAAAAAQDAADALVADVQELMASMQDLSHDPSNTLQPIQEDQGDSTSHSPHTPSVVKNIPYSPRTDLSMAETHSHVPDPFHEREEHRRRTRLRRTTEAAAKVRRSQRIAAKQEVKFVGMLELAVSQKASRFDLSAASPSLTTSLEATGLVDDPHIQATDMDAICAVATECGATEQDLQQLHDTQVPAVQP